MSENRSAPRWTKRQQAAIKADNGDVFVSAGAGSGKTAVLVERCLYLIADGPQAVSLHSLLVVTFTEAAAAQMRGRLRSALRERLAKEPANQKLRDRLAELDQAQISTIHSFCHRIIREHFHQLDIDPGFAVMDENQSAVLQQEILEHVFERAYGQEGPEAERFRNLVECYGNKLSDENLRSTVLRVNGYLGTLHDPDTWLASARRNYAENATGQAGGSWISSYLELVNGELALVAWDLERGMRVAEESGIEKYRQHAAEILNAIRQWEAALRSPGGAEVIDEIHSYQVPRLPGIPKTMKDKASAARAAIDDAKNRLKAKVKEGLCSATFPEMEKIMRRAAPLARAFCDVVEDFRESYTRAKAARALFDFADLEHLAFRLLRAPESRLDRPLPSSIARDYQRRFAYVLVDEYQDTSPIQDAILSLVSRAEDSSLPGNRFLVGDVKQCIYGFRQAEPKCFLKKVLGSEETKDSQVIPLQKNFRSRERVIAAINEIFGSIMNASLSGLAHDQSSELIFGAEHLPAGREPGPHLEVHFLEGKIAEGEESVEQPAQTEESSGALEFDAAEREAIWMARRIRAMVGEDGPESSEFEVWDSETKKSHPVAYRDIAVLLRTTRHKARIYAQQLQGAGVPVFADTRSGLFDATEIQDVCALLQVVDNPRQDIPLAALLRSPIVGWTESDLARVRLAFPSAGHFWDAVIAGAQEGPTPTVQEKCRQLLAALDDWRSRFRRAPAAHVVQVLLNETGYLAYVEGLPGGPQRRANLLHFLNLVRLAETGPRRGIRPVLDFIRALEDSERDLGTAQPLPPTENVVRVMSIHRSKGLEFPVVFVPDLGKRFNLSDTRGDVLVHRDAGLGLRAVDLEARLKYPTALHRVVARTIRQDGLDEELRVFYVALTRARERLILSATVDLSRDFPRWTKSGDAGPSASHLISAQRPVDWIGPVVATHPDGDVLRRAASQSSDTGGISGTDIFQVSVHPWTEVSSWLALHQENSSQRAKRRRTSAESLLRRGPTSRSKDAVAAIEQLEWRYPYHRSTRFPSRFRVTSLESMPRMQEFGSEGKDRFQAPWAPQPEFLGFPAEPSSLKRGIAVHRFLELVDLERPLTEEDLDRQADELTAKGLFEPRERTLLMVSHLADFFESPLGQKVSANAASVRREVPFTLSVSSEGLGLEVAPSGEKVLVHGVIDCLVPDEDGFLLIDYKTDRMTREDIAVRLDYYRPQLDFYRRAVEALCGGPVGECYVVFLWVGEAVLLDSH